MVYLLSSVYACQVIPSFVILPVKNHFCTDIPLPFLEKKFFMEMFVLLYRLKKKTAALCVDSKIFLEIAAVRHSSFRKSQPFVTADYYAKIFLIITAVGHSSFCSKKNSQNHSPLLQRLNYFSSKIFLRPKQLISLYPSNDPWQYYSVISSCDCTDPLLFRVQLTTLPCMSSIQGQFV